MKRTYETLVIFDGSLTDDQLAKEQETIETFFKTNADFIKTDQWGKRTMAYEIKRKKTGLYNLYIYDGEKDIAEKFYKAVKLNTKILRHMTVLHEEVKEVAPETIKAEVDTEEGDE
ncbi:MAG: 30S ribosomal protein S6 [Chitinivibrionales bacterium]|nr:30S ribosomal protein S6 [Chitinivibrionales bacterium]